MLLALDGDFAGIDPVQETFQRTGMAALVGVYGPRSAARQVISRVFNASEAAWREANPDPSAEDLSLVEAWLRIQAGLEQPSARYAFDVKPRWPLDCLPVAPAAAWPA